MNTKKFSLSVLPLILPFGLAQADIFVVDDDGGAGVDYTDIQAAIDGANHGDVVIVNPGNYAGFVLDRGLTLLGAEASDTSVITSHATISNVPNPRRAILTGFRMESLSVTGSSGHVILDSLVIQPTSAIGAALSVGNCADVRVYESTVRATHNIPSITSGNGVQVVASRFEAINSSFTGGSGSDSGCSSNAGHGGTGLWSSNSSKLAVFQTDCLGGRGGDAPDFCEWEDPSGGNGGDGLYLRGSSSALLAGPDTIGITEGDGGYGDCFPFCFDGWAGDGMTVEGSSTVRYSGVQISSQDIAAGSGVDPATPNDPYLERFGTLQAGRQQTFWVYGDPGDQVTFYIGRAPTVTVDPTQFMDDLVSHQRSYNLGTIGASGRKQFLFTIPSWFPTAFDFYVQSATTNGSGQRTLTNSIPMVLRYLPE